MILVPPALGQVPGTCVLGTAQGDLDVNNIFARVFNTGALFYGNTTTAGDGYLAPKASGNSPIFAAGLWVGGKVNGTIRVAGGRYTGFTFWPGPLDETARPVNPQSCSAYDRIYSVTRADINSFQTSGELTDDLRDWPFELGAPVVDGDGNPDNYDLERGDSPEIVGDQGVWWLMNDVGNTHGSQNSDPIGIEVRVLAFAFARSDALGDITFYRYNLTNRNLTPIDSMYAGFFVDPDLGDATDDYVGYDLDRGMGYVYNADEEDSTYGIPPAAGFDMFEAPPVNGLQVGATSFPLIHKAGPSWFTEPQTALEYFNRLQGLWGDGTSMIARGEGIGPPGSAPETLFGYPGDPITGEGWSERFPGAGPFANPMGDRRLLLATGPFQLAPGETGTVTLGIVFAHGTDNLDSIIELRKADDLAQVAYEGGFRITPLIEPPPLCTSATYGSGQCLEVVSSGNGATLVWGYPPTDPNYLGQFDERDRLLAGQTVEDSTYTFEGFNVYRYPFAGAPIGQRERVATYDVENGVTRVVDNAYDPETGLLIPQLVATGSDSGVQFHHELPHLVNHMDYAYSVSAYAYNAESYPKVVESRETFITVRPSGLTGGDRTQSASGLAIVAERGASAGDVSIRATVVDPGSVTGDSYDIRFYHPVNTAGSPDLGVTTYDIVNSTTGAGLVDGQAYFASRGRALPQGDDIAVFDGLSFSIRQPEDSFKAFLTVANAAGQLAPLTGGASAQAGYPVPQSPGPEQQVSNARWLFSTGGRSTFADFLLRATRGGDNNPFIFPFDFEMRWTGSSVAAKNGIFGQSGDDVTVPFELWNIGIGTPDDTADDVRLIPVILDNDDDGAYNLSAADSPIDAGEDDPETDWIYWYSPADTSPGSSGYLAYENGGAVDASQIHDEILARTTLVGWNLGAAPPYNPALPEQGTVFRITTYQPAQPGDVFTLNTAGLERITGSAEEALASLDRIEPVPNPYVGGSAYEADAGSRIVRFTNMPQAPATIRIYTVGGTLAAVVEKRGAGNSVDWNLETQGRFLAASGMYIAHISVEGIGERVLKLAVIQRGPGAWY